MTALRFIFALLLARAACGRKPVPVRAPGPAAAEPTTAALWRLAPEGSSAGIVAGDGFGTELIAAAKELQRIMAARPLLDGLYARFVAELSRGVERELGLGLGTFADLAAYGLDPSRGAAIFFDHGAQPTLAILPVSDPASFARRMKLRSESVGGRTLYRDATSVCAALAERFACAQTAAALVAPATGSPLVALAASIPAAARGGVEIVGDAKQNTMIALGAESEPFRRVDAVVAAARVERGVVEAYLRVDGELAPAPLLDAAPSLAPVAGSSAAAVRLGLAVARMDAADRAELAALAGETLAGVQTVSLSLASPLGLDLGFELRVELGGEVALALPALCRAGAAATPVVRDLVVEGDRCRAVIDFGGVGGPTGLVALPVSLTRAGNTLVLRAGREAPAVSVAASPRLEPILSGGAPLVLWGRSFDPLAAVGAEQRGLAATLMASSGYPLSAEPVTSIRWLLAHLTEAGVAIGVTGKSLEVRGTLVTYAADPPAVYAAYERAVGLDLGGDFDGYRRAMAALRDDHADTVAGRQAAVVAKGAPMLGAGTVTMLALAAPTFTTYVRRAKASEAPANARRLYDAAQAYYREHGVLPAAVGPTPAVGACCGAAGVCRSQRATWDRAGWAGLGFAIAGEHYYSYELRIDGDQLVVRAIGDLDCDGTRATYELRGAVGQAGDGGWLSDAAE